MAHSGPWPNPSGRTHRVPPARHTAIPVIFAFYVAFQRSFAASNRAGQTTECCATLVLFEQYTISLVTLQYKLLLVPIRQASRPHDAGPCITNKHFPCTASHPCLVTSLSPAKPATCRSTDKKRETRNLIQYQHDCILAFSIFHRGTQIPGFVAAPDGSTRYILATVRFLQRATLTAILTVSFQIPFPLCDILLQSYGTVVS